MTILRIPVTVSDYYSAMYPRFASALLFSFLAIGLTNAFVAPDCGPNGEFKSCGSACEPTCANPKPTICTLQCVMGCFCKPGFMKNEKGECVRPENCEAQNKKMLFAYPPDMQCKENEVFMPCGSACPPTCANPHASPICTKQCVIGCFCKPGYLRQENGECVSAEKCGVPAMQDPVCAGENEEFRQCKGCDATCTDAHPICPRICVQGCACKEGHVRNTNGKCIKKEQCPKINALNLMMMPPVCKGNEVFKTCGTACPATCDNPHPSAICTKNCVIGCFCKEGYLKHANGMCVPAANCQEPVAISSSNDRPFGDDILCPTDREIYIEDDLAAQYNCMQSCDTPLPFMIRGRVIIPKKCKEVKPGAGCVCRFPYYRNEEGKCVERKECHKTEPFMTTPPTPAHWIP